MAAAVDGTAVEVGAFVLFVHPDQPADVGIGGWGALQGSVLLLLLLKHRLLALGVLAALSGQERVPNFSILLGAGDTGSAQLYGRIFSVSPGQERPNSSTTSRPSSSACAVGGGVFTQTRFGVCRLGTDAGHQPTFIGSGLGAGLGG